MVNCSLSPTQVENLYKLIYKQMLNSLEPGESFNQEAFMTDLFEKIEKKADVNTASTFLQIVPTLMKNAVEQDELEKIDFDLNTNRELINKFRNTENGLFKTLKYFRPKATLADLEISMEIEKGIINTPESDQGDELTDILNDPFRWQADDALTSTMQELSTRKPDEKDALGKEEKDPNKLRIYRAIRKIKEKGTRNEGAPELIYQGKVLKLKTVKLTSLAAKKLLDKTTAQFVFDSNSIVKQGTSLEDVTPAKDIIALVVSDEKGAELFFDENGNISTQEDGGQIVYQFLRDVRTEKDSDKLRVTDIYGLENRILSPADLIEKDAHNSKMSIEAYKKWLIDQGTTYEELLVAVDNKQQESFKELQDLRDAARTDKPKLLNITGISAGIVDIFFSEKSTTLDDFLISSKKIFKDLTIDIDPDNFTAQVYVNDTYYTIDRPNLPEEYINQIAAVLVNPNLTNEQKNDFYLQFTSNTINTQTRKLFVLYNTVTKELTAKYRTKTSESAQLFDLSAPGAEKIIIDSLLYESTYVKTNGDTQIYATTMGYNKDLLASKGTVKFYTYDRTTGKLIAKSYKDFLKGLDLKVLKPDTEKNDKDKSVNNPYFKFRIDKDFIAETEKAKEEVKSTPVDKIKETKDDLVAKLKIDKNLSGTIYSGKALTDATFEMMIDGVRVEGRYEGGKPIAGIKIGDPVTFIVNDVSPTITDVISIYKGDKKIGQVSETDFTLKPKTTKATILKEKEEKLANIKPVYHHTSVAAKDFDFGTFQRGKDQISQFGDGLNASSNTTSFLVKRYGKAIQGEVNDADFVIIDANKSEKELHDELIAKGYKLNTPQHIDNKYYGNSAESEYDGSEPANINPSVMSLFNDFQQSNPNVKGVKVINHILGTQKIAPFYVIYDAKTFYGQGELTKKIEKETNEKLINLEKTTPETPKTKKEEAKEADELYVDKKEIDINKLTLNRLSNLPNDVTQEQIDAVPEWWDNSPLSKFGIQLEHMANIVNSDVYARFIIAGKRLSDTKIQLDTATGGSAVDLYHEAWHAFSQLFLTKEQKIKLYAEVRKRLNNYDLSSFEVEEIIAEDFREYAKNPKAVGDAPIRNTIFRRIWNFIKTLFGKRSIQEDLFERLYFASKNPKLLNKFTPLVDNAMFNKLNRARGIMNIDTKELALNYQDSLKVSNQLDSALSVYIDKVYEIRETNFKNNVLALADNLVKSNKAGTIQILTDNKNRAEAYEWVKSQFFEKYTAFKTELDNTPEEDFNKRAVLNNKIRILKETIKNWDNTLVFHKEHSTFDLIKQKYIEIDEEESEINEDTTGTEVVEESERFSDKKVGEKSLLQLAEKETLYILKSLFKVVDGKQVEGPLGFPDLVDFSKIWNTVTKVIGGEKDPVKMYLKLKEAIPFYPELAQLVNNKFPDPRNIKTLEEFNIKAAFWQDFKKPLIRYVQLTVDKDKETGNYKSEVTDASIEFKNIINSFKSNFNSSAETKYISKNENNKSALKLDALIKAFPTSESIALPAQQIEFVNALGIGLQDLKSIKDELGNKKSKYSISHIYGITKSIDTLNKNPKLTNDKQKEFIKKFIDNPIDALYGKIPAGIYTDTTSEKAAIQKLARLQSKFGNNYSSFSVLNAEKKLVNEFTEDSTVTMIVDAINNVKNGRDLWMNKGYNYMSYLNPLINGFTEQSQLLKTIFEVEENTWARRGDAKLDLVMVSGTQIVNLDGTNTTSLDVHSKYIQELNMMLKSGFQEFMRHASKSSSFGMKSNKLNLYVDIEKFKPGGDANQYAVDNIFLGYIQAELLRIQKIRGNKEEYKKYVGYNREIKSADGETVLGMAGEFFTAFDNVLTKDTKEEIIEKVKDGKLLDYLESDPKLKKDITEQVSAYFERQSADNKKDFQKSKWIDPALTNKLKVYELSTDDEETTLIKAHTMNAWIHNFETASLIYGDIVQYNHAKQELHKRNPGSTSGGRGFMDDLNTQNFLNSDLIKGTSYGAKLATMDEFGSDYAPFSYSKTYNTAIMQEVKRSSVYVKNIEKGLREDYKNRGLSQSEIDYRLKKELKPYKEMEEGDGQGYITIDAYRLLRLAEKNWSSEQEDLFQKVISGKEVNTEDITQIFPVYKLQHFGHLANTSLPVNAMHKFALMPLIPSLIVGSDLESLHHQMMKGNIQYATFESGSKVGSITSQLDKDGKAVADQIYDDNGAQKTLKSDIAFTPNTIYLAYLKNVTAVPIKLKGKTVFSTQLRKMILEGLYENGKLVNQEYAPFVKAYEDAVNANTEILKIELLNEIGYEYKDGKYVSGDLTKFMDVVQRELTRKDLPEHLIDYIQVGSNNVLTKDLSLHMLSGDIEKMITSLVEKRIVKQKVKGEALVQVASSMTNGLWDSGFKFEEAQAAEIEKYSGTNNLPFYNPDSIDLNVKYKDYTKEKLAELLKTNKRVIAKHANYYTARNKYNLIVETEYIEAVLAGKKPKVTLVPGNTSAMKVAIALQGDFKNLLKLKDLDGVEIGTRERLNELIKNDEWLNKGNNRKSVTLSSVRIPVQGMNSMEFMEVYEFLDPAAGSIIILPSEIVAKSGSDYDVDKLTTFMPNIDANGNYVTSNISEETLKKLIANAESKGDKAEVVKLIALQKKAIENRLIDSIRGILQLPDNYATLVRPNETYLMKDIADDLVKSSPEYGRYKTISPTNTLEVGYNLAKHDYNMTGKDVLGIIALENALHPLYTALGAALPKTYYGSVKNKRTKKYEDDESIIYDMRLLLDHNKTEDGRISLSGINSVDGQDKIADLFSHLMNGSVDVEKDAWIFFIQANKELIPMLLNLLKAGVPKRDAVYFISQPLVKEYANQQRLYASTYANLTGKETLPDENEKYNALQATLRQTDISDAIYKANENRIAKGLKEIIADPNNPFYHPMSTPNYKDVVLAATEGMDKFTTADLKETMTTNDTTSPKAIAIFLHYLEYERQIKDMADLKRQSNPDTATSKTIQEIMQRKIGLDILSRSSKIDQDLVRKLRKESILGSFFDNVITQDLVEPLFPLTDDKRVSEYLLNYIKNNNIPLKFGEGADGITNFITSFKQAMVNYIYQNRLNEIITTKESFPGVPELFNSLNHQAYVTRFMSMISENTHLKELYSILEQVTDVPVNIFDSKTKQIKGQISVLTLNNKPVVKGALSDSYHQNLIDLADENVIKVKDPVKNKKISDMFKILPLISILQNGVGNTKYGLSYVLPDTTYFEIVEPASREFIANKMTTSTFDKIAAMMIANDPNVNNYIDGSIIFKSAEPSTSVANKINFEENQTGGYPARTKINASADATIHLAINFETPGEKLTKKSVNEQGKTYIALNANTLKVTPERVNKLVDILNSKNVKTLNIAGNGIYDMKQYTQEQVDEFTYQLLNSVINSPNLKTKITGIRSGGQTGFDEAGAKAGMKLGIPTTVLAPKDWEFRTNAGNVKNEEAFKARFKPTQPSTSVNSNDIYSELENKNVVISNIKTKDGKYDRDANIKEAKANNRVYTMEVVSDVNSFSNPWASFNRTGTIKTNSTKEAVINYIDWLTTDKFKDVKSKRKAFILDVLKSGKLKGRQLQYYAKLGEPSHATALDYLINKYDWNTQSSTQQQAPVSEEISDELQNIISESGLEKEKYEIALVDGKQTFIALYSYPEKLKKGYTTFYSMYKNMKGLVKKAGKKVTIPGFEDIKLMMEQDTNEVYELSTGLGLPSKARTQKEILKELEILFKEKDIRAIVAKTPKINTNITEPGQQQNAVNRTEEVINAIKNELPIEISDSVTVLAEVPLDIMGRKDLFLSLKDILHENGVTDEVLINWLGVNKDKVSTNPNYIMTNDQLTDLVERVYDKKTDPKQYIEFKTNKVASESFNKWVAALERYPVAFRDIMLTHAIKYLNPQRKSQYVLQLSDVALTNTYGILMNKPHEANRLGKLYDKEVLATVSDALGHEPSASGNGYWVHVPRTESFNFMGYPSYEQFKNFTEKAIESIKQSIQYQKENLIPGKYEDLIDELKKLESKEVVFSTQEPSLDKKTADKYGFEDFTFVRVESTYSRWNRNGKPSLILRNQPHIEQLGEDYEGYYIHGYNTERGKPDTKIVKITKEQAEEIWEKEKEQYPEYAREIGDRNKFYNLKNDIQKHDPAVIKNNIESYEEKVTKYKEQFKTVKKEDWGDKARNFSVNVDLLRKLSPSTWCTSGSMTEHYVENYDNYLLIVNGVTVAGIEAYPGDTTPLIKGIGKDNSYLGLYNSVEELEKIYDKGTFTYEIIYKDKIKVKEVTSRNNNGMASIDYLDDTIAFFEKHNLDLNNASIQKAINQRDDNKLDSDFSVGYDENYDPDFFYDEPDLGWDPRYDEQEYIGDVDVPGNDYDVEDVRDRVRLIDSIEEVMDILGNNNENVPRYFILRYFPDLQANLRDNEELARTAVEYDGHNIAHVNPNLPFYNELAEVAVRRNAYVFQYLSEEAKQIPGLRQIYDDYEELPFSKTTNNQIQGYYDVKNDKVVVIAANTPTDEAAKVAIHEVAHRGMLRMAKDLNGTKELYEVLFNAKAELRKKLPELLKRTGHKNAQELIKDYGFDINTEDGQAKLLMELAARWAETLIDKPKPSWWKKLIESIQKWIAKFTNKTLTEKEVNELVGGFVKYGTKVKSSSSQPINIVNSEEEPDGQTGEGTVENPVPEERNITVDQYTFTLKPDNKIYFGNGKELTEQTIKNKVYIRKEFQDGTLRVSTYNKSNYYILSDNTILGSGKTNLAKETVSNSLTKERILEAASLYKKSCPQ